MNCQELQNKISQLKDLKQKFEASYADFKKQIEIAPSDETAKRLALDKINPYRDEIEAVFSWFEKYSLERQIKVKWQKFYQEVIKKAIPDYKIPDFENVKVPEYQEGFGWTVIVDKNLTYNQIKKVCEVSFDCELNFDLEDIDFAQEERSPQKNGSYAIRIRNREESDKENANMSANQIKEQQIKTMTLLERLILELYHTLGLHHRWSNDDYDGNYLDVEGGSITLCSGSRYLDGYVPFAGYHEGKFKVLSDVPNGASDDSRARTVIA